MNEGEMCELNNVYIGRDTKFKTRIIIYKLTKEQLEKRRTAFEKNAKKKGITKNENTIELLEASVYITNVRDTDLTPSQIYEMYTLRWQIEIVFKTWKSIFHIQNVKKVKIERLECQLYGKLILLLLSSTIMCKMRVLLLLKKRRKPARLNLLKSYANTLRICI
jgi:IS4 transposase